MDDLDAVELGCGTGYVSSWLLRRGARPVGLDNSANQLATARRFQEEFSVSFPLVQGDAEDAPFPDESFDLVISEYGAAIWCDPYRWIPEAARMLHPGGRLRFLGHSPLAMLCSPYGEDVVPIDDRLVRDQFGMHRFDWSDVHVVQLGPDYARRVGSSLLAFAEDPGASYGSVQTRTASRWTPLSSRSARGSISGQRPFRGFDSTRVRSHPH